MASVLNGSKAQFEVGWNNEVIITTGRPYTPAGSEMSTPFSGDRTYTDAAKETKVNGKAVGMDAIILTDDNGGGYTYYKLRDLGKVLGFNVSWFADKGIVINSNEPYSDAN